MPLTIIFELVHNNERCIVEYFVREDLSISIDVKAVHGVILSSPDKYELVTLTIAKFVKGCASSGIFDPIKEYIK